MFESTNEVSYRGVESSSAMIALFDSRINKFGSSLHTFFVSIKEISIPKLPFEDHLLYVDLTQ